MQILKEIIRNSLSLSRTFDSDYHTPETSLSSYTARNLCLVNSTWWYETNQNFLRLKKPLFAFTIFHPTPSSLEITAREKMAKFIDFFTHFLDKSPPPISLTVIIDDAFTSANDTRYLQMIFQPKSVILSLVKLTITDESWSTHTFSPQVPSNLKLPCLEEVCYTMEEEPTNGNFLTFMNSILNAAITLKKLSLYVPACSDPNDFIYWTLPSSLTHLAINSENILTRLSPLNQSNPATHITFPRLKMLEVYGYITRDRTFDNSTIAMFASTMANLQKIKLNDLLSGDFEFFWFHPPGLRNWPTVEILELENFTTISQEIIASIHQSFPSVIHFTFDFRLAFPQFTQWIKGIRYLFQEMTQLKSLKLSIICRQSVFLKDFMLDSVFLGITWQEVTQLRQDPRLWENFSKQEDQTGQGGNRGQQQVSGGIRSLRHLKSLYLGCSYSFSNTTSSSSDDEIPDDGPPKPISPLVFKLGFMQLPNLVNLTLSDGFSIGMQKIGKEWLEQSAARTLVIS